MYINVFNIHVHVKSLCVKDKWTNYFTPKYSSIRVLHLHGTGTAYQSFKIIIDRHVSGTLVNKIIERIRI